MFVIIIIRPARSVSVTYIRFTYDEKLTSGAAYAFHKPRSAGNLYKLKVDYTIHYHDDPYECYLENMDVYDSEDEIPKEQQDCHTMDLSTDYVVEPLDILDNQNHRAWKRLTDSEWLKHNLL
jgi:hypothetical protein